MTLTLHFGFAGIVCECVDPGVWGQLTVTWTLHFGFAGIVSECVDPGGSINSDFVTLHFGFAGIVSECVDSGGGSIDSDFDFALWLCRDCL